MQDSLAHRRRTGETILPKKYRFSRQVLIQLDDPAARPGYVVGWLDDLRKLPWILECGLAVPEGRRARLYKFIDCPACQKISDIPHRERGRSGKGILPVGIVQVTTGKRPGSPRRGLAAQKAPALPVPDMMQREVQPEPWHGWAFERVSGELA